MPTIIFPSSGYFVFFSFLRLSTLIYRLYVAREFQQTSGKGRRLAGDPCSRFIEVRDIDKTRFATRVTTPRGRAVAKVTRSDSI